MWLADLLYVNSRPCLWIADLLYMDKETCQLTFCGFAHQVNVIGLQLYNAHAF